MKSVSTYSYTDIGDRRVNEDAYGICIYEKNIVAVIADGLGGQGDGGTASKIAAQHLFQCGRDKRLPDKDQVSEAFQAANEAVLSRQSNQFHMKTTAVYLCIREKYAIWAHVGDSRLYHFQNAGLCHYTLDHSLSQMAVLMGEIGRRDIPAHPQRSRLLKALGCEGEEAEVHDPVLLGQGRHAFLLCTDGFWEYLNDEEILALLLQSGSAEMWIRKMRTRIQKCCRGNQDNNTAAAIILEV